MSDLARRLVAAGELFESARLLLAVGDPYDVAQTSSVRELEALATRLRAAADRAAARS